MVLRIFTGLFYAVLAGVSGYTLYDLIPDSTVRDLWPAVIALLNLVMGLCGLWVTVRKKQLMPAIFFMIAFAIFCCYALVTSEAWPTNVLSETVWQLLLCTYALGIILSMWHAIDRK